MKPSEFYQKWWKCKLPDGTIVEPKKLSEKELFYMDEVFNNKNLQGIYFGRRRRPSVTVNIEQMKKDIERLPDFLKQDK